MLAGKATNSPAMAKAKTAPTSQIRKKMISRNRTRERGPMKRSVSLPTLSPSWRIESTRAPKSWLAPMKIAPTTIHNSAGTQPQTIAMAGPRMGAAPAIEAKWCPHNTSRRVGTKSTPSSRSMEGRGSSSRSWKTRRAR